MRERKADRGGTFGPAFLDQVQRRKCVKKKHIKMSSWKEYEGVRSNTKEEVDRISGRLDHWNEASEQEIKQRKKRMKDLLERLPELYFHFFFSRHLQVDTSYF